MTEEKQQMLSDLYTLRAGLSLISQYVDVVRANERIIENTVEDNDFTKFVEFIAKTKFFGDEDGDYKKYNDINMAYGWYRALDFYRDGANVKLYREKSVEDYATAISNIKDHPKKYEIFFNLLKDDNLLNNRISQSSKLANKSLGLKVLSRSEREYKKKMQGELERLQQFKSVKDDLIRQHEAWLAKSGDSSCEVQNTAIAKMKNSQLEITCQKPKIQAVFSALDEAFSEQLDKRDWGNLDMVIYYVETNRADSRKEALQLLDRERQTQDIIRAVNTSAAWLGNLISQESQRICGIIGAGFTQLNKRLNDVMNLQYSQMQMQAQQMQMQARQMQVMQKQISQTEFTNALLQKSNESSQKMMDDFYLMKQKYNL